MNYKIITNVSKWHIYQISNIISKENMFVQNLPHNNTCILSELDNYADEKNICVMCGFQVNAMRNAAKCE